RSADRRNARHERNRGILDLSKRGEQASHDTGNECRNQHRRHEQEREQEAFAHHVDERCGHTYPRSKLSIRRRQPSIATNNTSLNGNATVCGVVVCSPSDANPSATTKSITRNGMKMRMAIANASRSSVVMKAGASTHSSSPAVSLPSLRARLA